MAENEKNKGTLRFFLISQISPLVGTPQTWFNTLWIALALRIPKDIETCP